MIELQALQRRPVVSCEVSNKIPAQVAFWRDSARVRGFVGGVGSGKTFAGVAEILNQPRQTAGVVVAPTYRLLKSVTQKTFFEVCPRALIQSHNKTDGLTVLWNGLEIYWRSAENADNLRGLNLGWCFFDEAAFCSEESWRVALARLRRQPGRAWIATTPRGQDNWVYHWFVERAASNGYSMHNGRTMENPFNLPTYYEDLKTQLESAPLYAAQELDGAFVDLAGSKRFPTGLVEQAFKRRDPLRVNLEPVELDRDVYAVPPAALRVYFAPEHGKQYAIGADCAEGISGGDDSTAVVVDRSTGAAVAVLAAELEPYRQHPAALAALSRFYNNAPVMVERNNHGHAVIGTCQRLGIPVLDGPDNRPGWNTSAVSKAQAFTIANDVVLQSAKSNTILFYDLALKNQIASIERLTLRAPGKATRTKVDDLAIGWVLAQQARTDTPTAAARSRQATRRMWG